MIVKATLPLFALSPLSLTIRLLILENEILGVQSFTLVRTSSGITGAARTTATNHCAQKGWPLRRNTICFASQTDGTENKEETESMDSIDHTSTYPDETQKAEGVNLPNMFFAKLLSDSSNRAREMEKNSEDEKNSGQGKDELKENSIPSNATLPYTEQIAEYISRPRNEIIDAALVLLSSFVVAVETLPETALPDFLSPTILNATEAALSYFFCLGYLLRWVHLLLLSL